MDALELAALRLAIGEQPSEELPGLATDALVLGVDSPALRELAGTSCRDVREAKDLFLTAMEELGIDRPDEQSALWALVRHEAEQMIAGQLEPYTGASWIWHNAYHRVEMEGDLRVFVGLASEWEDHPSHRPEIEARIAEEARVLLARREPRRWVKVMARQGHSPLSVPRSDTTIDPGELPLPPNLADDLTAWAVHFDCTFADDPARSGFASYADAEAFVDRGRQLVDGLQETLGPSWHVEYMPEPIRPPGVRLRQSRR